ncbi:MAG: hypothetical protein HC875_41645 [Anaerolineales bacterium]|nr:hypothetical protein [Anaerolineales bacterium]
MLNKAVPNLMAKMEAVTWKSNDVIESFSNPTFNPILITLAGQGLVFDSPD